MHYDWLGDCDPRGIFGTQVISMVFLSGTCRPQCRDELPSISLTGEWCTSNWEISWNWFMPYLEVQLLSTCPSTEDAYGFSISISLPSASLWSSSLCIVSSLAIINPQSATLSHPTLEYPCPTAADNGLEPDWLPQSCSLSSPSANSFMTYWILMNL